ncbi:amidophosphoribosyltransferase [Candidatus Poriferisodalis sp.]|uniref:amidophosphoribosyltransferase n=1 Tax=Candidatus Poriferisodalis sp. TaxID=3101277 RepID=UPI003B02B757
MSGVDLDKPREACGVFGVYLPGGPVAHLSYLGLYALQHRGQESAGIAVSDGTHLTVVKDMGLVASAFDDRVLAGLTGDLAIGHTRYSTTGSSSWRAAQPFYRDVGGTEFALGHNGNLTNTAELASSSGMLDGTVTSDSDLVAELIAQRINASPQATRLRPREAVTEAIADVLPRLRGGFTFVVADRERLIGVRDPHGIWPLCLGRFPADRYSTDQHRTDQNGAHQARAQSGTAARHSGWALASENPALEVVGATFEREVRPGEMIAIDAAGCRSLWPFAARPAGSTPSGGSSAPAAAVRSDELSSHLCVFEFVYFSRPDTSLAGQNVHAARQRMGAHLASNAPVDADLVMPVPESGIPAAQGYARASGVAYGDGLVKNRYIGRTFIAPNQHVRSLGVRTKLNPIRPNIDGRRLVVVDDSIVRGTTTRSIIEMLRTSGAAEVHLRISSPPYRWPCFYGMDTGTYDELLAANRDLAQIQEYLGVDSLAYLSLEQLVEATGVPGGGFCHACLTGDYPVEIGARAQAEVFADTTGEPRRSLIATGIATGGIATGTAEANAHAGTVTVPSAR